MRQAGKGIKRFDLITASRVRLNILRSWDSPMISWFGLYLSDVLPQEEEEGQQHTAFSLEPAEVNAAPLQNGLQYDMYDKGLQSASLLDSVFAVKLLESGVAGQVDVSGVGKSIGFSLTYSGYLHVPADGDYVFQLESADGSLLFLGDELLISNDEPHETKGVERALTLKRGYYPIKVLYTSFRHAGFLRLCWQGPSMGLREVAPEFFFFKV